MDGFEAGIRIQSLKFEIPNGDNNDNLALTGTFTGVSLSRINNRSILLILDARTNLGTILGVLKSVSYFNGAQNITTPLSKTINVSYSTDGDTFTALVSRNVNYTPVNNAPVVLVPAINTNIYTENAAPTFIARNMTITDVDNSSTFSLQAKIVNNFQANQDKLFLSATTAAQQAISASLNAVFNATTGTITITSNQAGQTLTKEQMALAGQMIAYSNASNSPSLFTRVIELTANDGSGGISSGARVSLEVRGDNTAPQLFATKGLTIREGASVTLNTTNFSVADSDSPDSKIIIQVTSVAGGTFYLNKELTQPVNGQGNSAQFTWADIKSGKVTFKHDGTETAPSYSVNLINPDGTKSSNSISTTAFSFTQINDIPSIAFGSSALTTFEFTENSSGVTFLSQIKISDPDNLDDASIATIRKASLTIAGNYQTGADFLDIQDDLPQDVRDKISVFYAKGVLQIAAKDGIALPTFADWQSIFDRVYYYNNSQNPTTYPRLIRLQTSDGVATSNILDYNINVIKSNQQPLLTGTLATLQYVEGNLGIVVAPNISVFDNDTKLLNYAKVKINNNFQPGDILEINSTSQSFWWNYDSTNGELTIMSKGATTADFQAILRQVRYRSISPDPKELERAIVITVNDGLIDQSNDDIALHDSNSLTAKIVVIPRNSAPVLWGNQNYTLGYFDIFNTGIKIAEDVRFTDNDSTPVSTITVRITRNFVPGKDVLAIEGQVSVAARILYDADNGVLTIISNGVVGNAELNRYIQNIVFTTSDTTINKSLEIVVNDGLAISNRLTRDIIQSAEVPVPVITASSFNISEGGTRLITPDLIGLAQANPVNRNQNIMAIVTEIEGAKFINQNNLEITTFTLADINRGWVRLQHDGSEVSPKFNIIFKSPTGAATTKQNFTLGLGVVNDAPVLNTSQLNFFQGELTRLDSLNFNITDPDNNNDQLQVRVSNITNGYFVRNNTRATPDATGNIIFTYQDIVQGLIGFQTNGTNLAPNFSVALRDGVNPFGTAFAPRINFVKYNQLPILTNPQLTINEGQSLTLTATASNFLITDADTNSSLTLVELSAIRNGSILINNAPAPTNGRDADSAVFTLRQLQGGQVKFVHNGGEIAPSMEIRVYNEDAIIYSAPVEVGVNFTNINDKPVILNPTLDIAEGANTQLTPENLGVLDVDSLDSQVVINATNVLGGKIVVNGTIATQFTLEQLRANLVIFQHDGSEKAPSFYLQARDQAGLTSDRVLPLINFTYVNDAPTINKSVMTISEGQDLLLNLNMLSVTDIDSAGADVFIRIVDSQNGNFFKQNVQINQGESFTLLDIVQGNITFRHNGSEDTPNFTIEALNGDGRTSPQVRYAVDNTINAIKYTNVNDAPVVNDNIIMDPTSSVAGSSYRYQILPDAFVDSDIGDVLRYSATLKGGGALPKWLTLNTTTGVFTGKPTTGDAGTLSLTIYAIDKNRLTAYQDTTLTVQKINQAPSVATMIGSLSVLTGQFNYHLPDNLFSDANGDILTYNVSSLPSWMTFDTKTNILRGNKPDLGTDNVKITIFASDGLATASQTITFTNGSNNQPIISRIYDPISVSEDIPFTISLPPAFIDDDAFSLRLVTQSGTSIPSWLQFDANAMTLRGVANNDAVGTYNFLMIATDTQGVYNTQKLTFQVVNTFDDPVFLASIPNQTTNQSSIYSYQIPSNLFKATDKGQNFTYTANLANGNNLPSWLSFNPANGLFSGTPTNADVGSLTIALNIRADNGFITNQSFNLTIKNINDAPVAIASLPNYVILRNNLLDQNINPDTFSDPDGDAIRYTLTQADGTALPSWLKFNTSNLNMTGTPGVTDVGRLWLKLNATDILGATTFNNFYIEVSDINKAPTDVFLSNQIVTENAASGTFVGFLRVIDPDAATTGNGQHVIQVFDGDVLSSNFYYDNGNLRTLRALNFEQTPYLNIKVRGIDQNGLGIAIEKNFTITLTDLNDAPVLVRRIENQNFAEKSSFTYNIPASIFTDEDRLDSLSVSVLFKNPVSNQFGNFPDWMKYDTNGFISGTPTNDHVGSYTIRVIGTDTRGAQVISDHILQITNVNDAPSFTGANGTIYNGRQGTPVTIQITGTNFTDIDTPYGDRLTFSLTQLVNGSATNTIPSFLHFDPLTLTLSGTPGNEDVTFNKVYSFQLTGTDIGGLVASHTFALQILNTNDSPRVVGSVPSFTMLEDTNSLVQLNPSNTRITDIDLQFGDKLNYTIFQINNFGTDSQTVVGAPGWIQVNAETGALVLSPRNDAVNIPSNPVYHFRLVANDVASAAVHLDFEVSVVNVNDVPISGTLIPNQTILEDRPTTIFLPVNAFNDVDFGDVLHYRLVVRDNFGNFVSAPSFVSINSDTGNIGVSATNDDVNTYFFRIFATDNCGTSAFQDFNMMVSNTNDAPVLTKTIPSQAGLEGNLYSFDFNSFFSDPDRGDIFNLTFKLSNGASPPSFLRYNPDTRVLSGTPAVFDSGTYQIVVTATDAGGLQAIGSYSLFIDTKNHAPVGRPIEAASATEDSPFSFSILKSWFSDIDVGDSVTDFNAQILTANGVSGLPNWLQVSQTNTEIFLFSDKGPTNNDVGILTVRLGAKDTFNAWGYNDFSLVVKNVNDAPSASNIPSVVSLLTTLSITEEEIFSFAFPSNTFVDIDKGDVLTYNVISLPSWLSFNSDKRLFAGQAFRFDAPGLSATDYISYTMVVVARDQAGEVASQTINLNLKKVNSTPYRITTDTLSITENNLLNHFIGYAHAYDLDTFSLPDGQTNLKIFSGGVESNLFYTQYISTTFDPILGSDNIFKIFANQTFNYEFSSSYNLRLAATDNLGAGKTFFKDVVFSVVNIDEGPPAFFGSFTYSILENSPTDNAVFMVSAVDPDRDQIQFILTNNSLTDNSFFRINQQTGHVYFLNPPNFEARDPSYLVEVGALTVNGSSTKRYNVNILNIDEGAPLFLNTSAPLLIPEGRPINTAIFTAVATDPDQDSISYTLLNGWADNSEFSISSGALFFIKSPDYERRSTYTVRVVATANGASTTADVQVNIIDLPDTSITFISPSLISVNENVSNKNNIYQVLASNFDQSPISFSLASGVLDNNLFTISSGSLFFVNSPNYEDKPTYRVQIQATAFSQTFNYDLTILINNLDEFNPSFVASSFVLVPENTRGAFFTALATDGDQDIPVYNLTPQFGDNSLFSVNSATGGVTFLSPPDFEIRKEYNIQVQATTNSVVTSRNFLVSVTNEFEGAPSFTTPSVISYTENDINPAYTAVATDEDRNIITYSLANLPASISDNGFFSINSTTGVLSFLSPPDYEGTKRNFIVTLQANAPLHSSTYQLAINITNIDEFGPSLSPFARIISTATGLIPPSATVPFTIITYEDNQYTSNVENYSFVISASDAENDIITYFLDDGGSLSTFDNKIFTLNSGSGLLTYTQSFGYETGRHEFFIRVRAQSNQRTTFGIYTISVANVDEGGPSMPASVTISLPENTSLPFYTIRATETENDPIFYILDSTTADGAMFSVNSNTGALNIINPANFESSKTQYSINITARSGGSQTGQQIFINVTNVPEGGPSFTGALQFSLTENSQVSGTIFSITASDHDNDKITFTFASDTTLDKDFFILDSNTGAVRFSSLVLSSFADYEQKSLYQIKVRINAGGEFSETIYSLVINNLDDNVVSITSPASTTYFENAPTSLSAYQIIAIDADGSSPLAGTSFTFGIETDFDGRSFTVDASTGEVFFISSPNFEAKSIYEVNTFVISGKDKINKSVRISINNVNESGPVFTNIPSRSHNENEGGIITRITAVDGDGDPITYSLLDSRTAAILGQFTDNSLATISSDGVLSFISAPNYEVKNLYVFGIIAAANGDSTLLPYSVTINNIDEFTPSFTNPTFIFSIAENNVGSLAQIMVTDPDLVAPSFTLVNGRDIGRFAIDALTGVLSFTNSQNWELGSNTFNIIVQANSQNKVIQQTITLNITNENESAPVFTSVSITSVNENVSSGFFTVIASDPDFQSVTYFIASGGPNQADNKFFAIDSGTGVLKFITAPDFEAGKTEYSAVVEASDGTFKSQQTIIIHLNNLDESAPIFTSPSILSIAENTTGFVTQLTASDPDGNSFTFNLVPGNDFSSFSLDSSGNLSLNNPGNFESLKKTLNVRVRATSGARQTDYDLTINITDVDEGGPSFTSLATALSVNENNTGDIFTPSVSDIDGDSPKFILTNNLDNQFFTINSQTGAVRFSGTPDFETMKHAYSVEVMAVTRNLSATQVYSITMNDLDDNSPVFHNSSFVLFPENTSGAITTISVVDADLTPALNKIIYSIDQSFGSFSLFTINSLTGELSITQSLDYETQNNQNLFIKINASGTNGSVVNRVYEFSLTNVNESAPVITSPSMVSVSENFSAAFYTIVGNDGDGVPLTYSITGANANLFQLDSKTHQISFKTAPNFEDGNNSITLQLQLSDGELNTTKNLLISIVNVDESATIFTSSNAVEVKENFNQPFFTVVATDNDLFPITYILADLGPLSDNILFAINSQTGVLSFNTPPDYESRTSYIITVRAQADGGFVSQNITVRILNVDEAGPQFASVVANVSVSENSSQVFYTAIATDIDNDSRSYFLNSAVFDNAQFTINSTTGALQLLTPKDFETGQRDYNIEVTAVANGLSATQLVKLRLLDVDDNSPQFSDTASFALDEGSGTRFAFSAAAFDADISPEFNSITYSIRSGFQAELFTIDSLTGVVSVVSAVDFETFSPQPLTLLIRASSPNNKINERIYTINLNNVQEFAPVFTSANSAVLVENTSGVFYTANASDGDMNPLTYSLTGVDASLFTINSVSGKLSFISNSLTDFEGSKTIYNIILTAFDGSTTVNQNLSISLTNLNESATNFTSSNDIFANENDSRTFFSVVATDADAVPVTYRLIDGPDGVQDNALFEIDSKTGGLKFVSPKNYEVDKDTYFITVEATADGDAVTQQITIHLNNVDEFTPVITSPAVIRVDENFTGDFFISATDLDKNQNILFSLAGGLQSAFFTLNSTTGAIHFNHLSDTDFESGMTSFAISVTASSAERSTGRRLVISLNNLDEFSPTFSAASFAFSAPENTTGTLFQLQATDQDGNQISYSTDNSLFSVNSQGMVTANLNFEQSQTINFNLIASTSDGKSGTTLIKFNVGDVDEFAPSITNVVASVAFNENLASLTAVFSVTATDSDTAQSVTFSLASGADAALFSIGTNNGIISLTNKLDFESPGDTNDDGIYIVSVVATTGSKSDMKTITLSINNVNEGQPSFTSSNTFVIEENWTIGNVFSIVTAIDIDSRTDVIEYRLINSAATDNINFTIDSATGELRSQISLNYEGTNSFALVVTASTANGFRNQNLIISLTDVGEGNVSITTANFSAITISENTGFSNTIATFAASDPDSRDTIRFFLDNSLDNSQFTINSATGALRFKNGAPDFETASDSNGDNIYLIKVQVSSSDSTDFIITSLTVTNNNEGGPIFSSLSANTKFNINENALSGTVLGNVFARDIDSLTDVLSYFFVSSTGAFVSKTDQLTIDSATGDILVTGLLDFELTPSFTLKVGVVSSGQNQSATIETSVTLNDLEDRGPMYARDSITLNVAENLDWSFVASASTITSGVIITYSLANTPDAIFFDVNSETGVVSLKSKANYEQNQSFVIAVDAAAEGFTAQEKIILNINNVDEFAPSFTNATFDKIIDEGYNNSQVIFSLTGTDMDFNEPVKFKITSSFADGAFFTLDSSTGFLKFVSTFTPNFEGPQDLGVDNVYTVNIVAFNNVSVTNRNFNITINNLDESAPVFTDTNITNISVNESVAGGSVLFTARASDGDLQNISYTLLNTPNNSFFAINSLTGAVSLAQGLDFEASQTLSLTVTAQAGASTTQKQYIINLADVDEFAPSFVASQSSIVSVNENTASSVVILNASAVDGDIFQTINYTLPLNTNDNSFFSLSSDGKLRFLTAPDFESKNSYKITIQAQTGQNTTSKDYTILVQNVTEGGPKFAQSATSLTLNENASGVFTSITASDPDAGTIIYLLSGTNAADFTINSLTGALSPLSTTHPNGFDFENNAHTYSLTVVASTAVGFDLQNIVIRLNNVIETGEFGYQSATQTFSIVENNSFTYNASINDNNGLFSITYSLSDAPSGFVIDSQTGLVSHAGFDFETLPNIFNFTIIAKSGSMTASQEILINVGDEPDTNIIWLNSASSQAGSFAENTPIATQVFSVVASLVGSDIISYTMPGALVDNSFFSVSSDGRISLKQQLDFETKTLYSGVVVATTAHQQSSFTFTLSATNVQEGGAVFANSQASFALFENRVEVIGTISATDPDRDMISYTLTGADAACFTINSLTGVLSNTNQFDYEAMSGKIFSLTVRAESVDGFALQFVNIHLKDVAEGVGPSFTSAAESLAFDEGSPFSFIASAVNLEGNPVIYTLGTNTNAPSNTFLNSDTGLISLSSLDFETYPFSGTFTINVVATNGLGQSSTKSLLFQLRNLDESVPVFSSNTISTLAFDESIASTTTLFIASASDPDGTSVTYAISITGNTQGESFTIDSATGAVMFNHTPNFESRSTYILRVVANSGGSFSSHLYTINLNNLDEFNPSFTNGSLLSITSVNENINPSVVIYTASAVDGDLVTPTYSLASNVLDNNLFTLSNVGQLKFISSPDFEQKPNYSVAVFATAQSVTVSQTVVIKLGNLDDNAPVFVNNLGASLASITINSYSENMPATTLISLLSATDADGTAVTITLAPSAADNDNDFFTLTGRSLTFALNADYETENGFKPTYTVKAVATSGGSSTIMNININLQNILEGAVVSQTMAGVSNTFWIEDMNWTGSLTGLGMNVADDTVHFYSSGAVINLTSLGAGQSIANIGTFDLGDNARDDGNVIIISENAQNLLTGMNVLTINGNSNDFVFRAGGNPLLTLTGGINSLTSTMVSNGLSLTSGLDILEFNQTSGHFSVTSYTFSQDYLFINHDANITNFNGFSNAYNSGAIAASVVNGNLVIDFDNLGAHNNVLTLLNGSLTNDNNVTFNEFLAITQQNHLIFG